MKAFGVGLLFLSVMYLAGLLLCALIQGVGCFFAGVAIPHQALPPVSTVVASAIPCIAYASYAIGKYFEIKTEGSR